MNGDVRKQKIAFVQSYFALKKRVEADERKPQKEAKGFSLLE